MAPEPRKSKRLAEALEKQEVKKKEAKKNDRKAKALARRNAAQAARPIDPKATFLGQLYAEVAEAAQPAQSRTRSQLNRVDALLRIARTTHFLNSIQRTRRRKCREDLIALRNQQANARVQRVFSDVAEDAQRADSHMASRLEAIRWDQKFDELALNSSSLELFAKTRQLDFEEPIRSSNDHFRMLIHHHGRTFTNDELQHLTGENFGIKATENRTRHLVEPEFINAHLWVLPKDNGACAKRPKFECRNTKKLKQAYPESETDRMFSRLHEDIQQSIVLPDYKWPQQEYWPEKDPRYAGFENDACIGADCQKRTNSLFERKKRTLNDVYERCGCTLNEVDNYYGTPALQNLAEGSILDPYLGEIYPFFKKGGKGAVLPRYGSGLGAAYIMRGAISRRHPKPNAGKRSSSSASPPRKGGSKKDAEETVSSDAADLYATEYTHYAIDSAWRGNWTRYINHSCDPNTHFQSQNVGGRTEILVEACRDIEFGEEITVDYSDDYFESQKFACKCGVNTCKMWDEQNKTGNEVTLADAITQGTAPGWAVTANGQSKKGVVTEPKRKSAK